jgi:hypothetical protein
MFPKLPRMLPVRNAIIRTIILLVVAASAVCALGQESEFRWASRTQDKYLFKEVEAAFANDLRPDRETGNTLPMTGKFIERLGIRKDSAIVIIAEKQGKADPYTVFRAFNFNRRTKTKAPILGKDVEWLWMWRLEKMTQLTPNGTDIVFQFLTCTECETTRLLSSFHYESRTGVWQLRQWSKEDGAALVIGSDVQYGDDGFYYYDCLHTVRDLTGDGIDDVAVRCRESLDPDPEKMSKKRVTKDETLLYTYKDGTLSRMVVRKGDELEAVVQNALCETKPKSPLCRNIRNTKGLKHLAKSQHCAIVTWILSCWNCERGYKRLILPLSSTSTNRLCESNGRGIERSKRSKGKFQ